MLYVTSDEVHKWEKCHLEQQQLFVYTIAMEIIISITTVKTLRKHSSDKVNIYGMIHWDNSYLLLTLLL